MEGSRSPRSSAEDHLRSSDPVDLQATTQFQLEEISIQHSKLSAIDSGDQSSLRTGQSGTSKDAGTQFYLQTLPHKEEQRSHETDLRPEGIEPTRKHPQIPLNLSLQTSRVSPGRRLVNQNRLISSISTDPDSGGTSLLPASRLRPGAATADMLALWPFSCPSSLLDGNELGCGNPSVAGDEGTHLFRRLPVGLSIQSQPLSTDSPGDTATGVAGLVGQLSKMCADPVSGDRVSGAQVEHPGQSHGSPSRKAGDYSQNYSGDEVTQFSNAPAGAVASGHAEFRHFRYPPRSASLPPSPEVSYHLQTGETKREKGSNCSDSQGAGLVGRGRSLDHPHSQGSSYRLSHHRRSRLRLGSTGKRDLHVGYVDPRTEGVALQQEGDVRCTGSTPGTRSEPSGCSRAFANRQQHTGSLLKEGGGDQVDWSPGSDIQGAAAGRQFRHYPVSSIPSRTVQRNCGSFVTGQTHSRMAPSTSRHGGRLRQVGTVRLRPVRVSKVSRCEQVCLARLRRLERRIHECIQPLVELQARVDLPPSLPHSQDSSSLERVSGPIPTGGSHVASDLLAAGPGEEEPRATLEDPRSPERPSGSHHEQTSPRMGPSRATDLESWGWQGLVKDWAPQERELVAKSWRKSTQETYRAPIRRWVAWCRMNQVDPHAPRGTDLARFLAGTFVKLGLSHNTMLLHRSAIATFCSGNIGERIASDFLVRQVLKAVSVAKPRETKSQIWDTQVLLKWLSTPPKDMSLFEVSRRTAALLLVLSGRRVHDLSLLRTSEENFIDLGEEIILWPAFGSKTDRANFRQSGWRLAKHPNEMLCPIYWLRLLRKTSEPQRTRAGLDNLFISRREPAGPASPTVIANWVRSALKAAGIDSSPGSVRAAVASRGWLDNMAVQDILDRGNWKCVETFRNHYCRRIETKPPTTASASRASASTTRRNSFTTI